MIFQRIYVGVAIVVSLILLVSFFGVIITRPLITNGWLPFLIFEDMALLGVWGIWAPILFNNRYRKVAKPLNIVGGCLIAALFAGYWLYEWPKWQTPALLSSFILILLLLMVIFSYFKKRKAKTESVDIPK